MISVIGTWPNLVTIAITGTELKDTFLRNDLMKKDAVRLKRLCFEEPKLAWRLFIARIREHKRWEKGRYKKCLVYSKITLDTDVKWYVTGARLEIGLVIFRGGNRYSLTSFINLYISYFIGYQLILTA